MKNKITKLRIGKAKVVIYINDKRMDIAHNAYLENRLYVGKILTNKEIKELERRTSIDPYYEFAKKQLINRGTSLKSLRKKLKKKKLSDEDIDYVYLLANRNNIVDEEKNFNDALKRLYFKGYGKHKIKATLLEKGFELKRVESIAFDDKKELIKAKESMPFLVKKYSKYNHENFKRHISDALIRKGFDLEVVKQVIDTLPDKDEDDELNKLKNDYISIKNKYIKNHCDKDLDKRVIKYLMSKGYSFSDIERIISYEVD